MFPSNVLGNVSQHVLDFMKVVASPEPEPLSAAELGISYISSDILVMGFPSEEGKLIDNLSHFFRVHHRGRFMIINLSEAEYDYSKFENQVIDFKFPGYPAPPLNTLFNICSSIHGWLKADSANVVVIHCQSGHGRTFCVVAAYLLWSKRCTTIPSCLEHIASQTHVSVSSLVIPTQTRYLQYVIDVSDGRKPSNKLLHLQRVIMNGIPRFENDKSCLPYLQVFSHATLIYTSTGMDSPAKLREYTAEDASILFPMDINLEGDVLIRVRHISPLTMKKQSMLRFGFHTGFTKPGMMRFTKSQLDGAEGDARFDSDFFLDLIFDSPEDEKGRLLVSQPDKSFWDHVGQPTAAPAAGPADDSKFSLFGVDGERLEEAAAAAAPSIDEDLEELAALAMPDDAPPGTDSDTEVLFEENSHTNKPKAEEEDEEELLAQLLAS